MSAQWHIPIRADAPALERIRVGHRVLLVVLGALGLGARRVAAGARVPVMKVGSQGRIEPHNAVYRREPPGAGRVVRSRLNLDEEIKEGHLLIELDTRSERLELEQSKGHLEVLEQELSVIRDQIASPGSAHPVRDSADPCVD